MRGYAGLPETSPKQAQARGPSLDRAGGEFNQLY